MSIKSLLCVQNETATSSNRITHDPLTTTVHHRTNRHQASTKARSCSFFAQLFNALNRTIRARRIHSTKNHVFMTPHDTLGHSGRSTRVQHVHVIGGAAREITIG